MSVMHVDVQCLCDDVVLCSFLLCENSEEGETKKEGENNFKILQFQQNFNYKYRRVSVSLSRERESSYLVHTYTCLPVVQKFEN